MQQSNTSVRLLSILAFACLAFVVSMQAQAQRTRTGGSTATGSELQMFIQIADEAVSIVCPSSPGGTCTGSEAYFDAIASTAGGQAVSCQWRANSTDPWTDATCTYSNLACRNFAVADCSAKGRRSVGTRTSQMACPTASADGTTNNVAGCTGTIHVVSSTGTTLEDITIGGNLSGYTKQECGQEFPTSEVCDNRGNCTQLKKFVIGQITQTCESGAAWSADDPVVEQAVRGDFNGGTVASYTSRTSWLDETEVQCNPNNGFPTGACNNDGGTWLTIPTSLVMPDTMDNAGCHAAAANLSCGQLADGSPGPAPADAKWDGTQCQFRCDRCGPDGTLVNVGEAGLAKYVLSDLVSSAPFAAACNVTVTGN